MTDTVQSIKVIVIDPLDNVATAVEDIQAGEELQIDLGGQAMSVVVSEDIPFGHKVALVPIAQGGEIVKYGEPIGTSLAAIQSGQHVHVHNTISNRGRGDLYGEEGESV